jgi:hypothetical protein
MIISSLSLLLSSTLNLSTPTECDGKELAVETLAGSVLIEASDWVKDETDEENGGSFANRPVSLAGFSAPVFLSANSPSCLDDFAHRFEKPVLLKRDGKEQLFTGGTFFLLFLSESEPSEGKPAEHSLDITAYLWLAPSDKDGNVIDQSRVEQYVNRFSTSETQLRSGRLDIYTNNPYRLSKDSTNVGAYFHFEPTPPADQTKSSKAP